MVGFGKDLIRVGSICFIKQKFQPDFVFSERFAEFHTRRQCVK